MMLTIIFLPLIGFLFAAFFSRYIGRHGSAMLTTILMFVNVLLTCLMFYKVSVCRRLYFINIGTWIYTDLLQVNWSFYFDNLTMIMLLVVNIVSALVHLYSTDYMAHDPHLPRFMSYLSLFTFFMLMLVTGDNFVILFLGWEGVGLCSYLLISFWYTRVQANKAAIKALIVNRVGDLALTLGILAIFLVFRSLDFHVVFPLAPFFIHSTIVFLGYELPVLTVICSLLFIGAMGKSAQIGLHTWLPDAMEGPTPVSALIHAATMVTAGVFLIIKCSPLFEYVPTVLSVITFVGAMTAFFSATIGLVQNDIKKVIAYSTCSQLGYMILACGLSNYHVSLFHLANHAFFKALLFLSAGAIIHSLSNEQDMRKFGGLILLLPYTSIMLLIGSLSLMGFPFLTGFYSKDLILEIALTKYTLEGSFAYCLGLITAFFTSFYSFRVFYLTFVAKNNSFRAVISHVHELPWKMAVSLAVLSFGSIFLGYFAKDLFVGLGTDFWNHSILILPEHNNQLEAEFFGLPTTSEFQSFWNRTYGQRWIKLLPFFLSLSAVALVSILYSHFPNPWLKKTAPMFQTLNAPYLFHQEMNLPAEYFLTGSFQEKMKYERQLFLTVPQTKHMRTLFELTQLFSLNSFTEEKSPVATYQFFLQKLSPSEKRVWNLRSLDDPLLPLAENTPNTYYQELIWNLHYAPRFFEKKNYKNFLRHLYRFLSSKWYFDAVYNEFINRPLFKMAYKTMFCSLDKGVLELFGPYGISYVLFSKIPKTKAMQTGKVYYYGYLMMMFLFVFLATFSYFS